MRLAFLLAFLALLVASPSFAQAPAASPFQEPVSAFFDSTDAQFGAFAQNGNAIFPQANGKAIIVPVNSDGTGFLRGIPIVRGGYIHFDQAGCVGTAAIATGAQGGSLWSDPDSDLLQFIAAAVSPQAFVIWDVKTLRSWVIQADVVENGEFASVSYLNYNVSISDSRYGECNVTTPGLPDILFRGMNWATDVTAMFQGWSMPLTLQPIPE